MNFMLRHPAYAIANPKRAWQITKAQRDYVKAHPVCAWTGRRESLEAHHIMPYRRFPELACDPMNFVTLTRQAHWIVGHGGVSWTYSVPNIRELCLMKEDLK